MADRRPSHADRRVITVLLGVGAAIGVAAASATLPVPVLLALIAAGAILVCLLLSRCYVNASPLLSAGALGPPLRQAGLHAASTVEHQSDPLSPARYLYYAGMATLGQTSIRPFGGFAISDWLFLLALLAALAGLVQSRTPFTFRLPAVVVVGVVLYVVAGLLSTFGAVAPVVSAGNVARFAYLTLVWFWLGTLVLSRPRHLRTAIAMWTASIAANGLAAILQARGVSMPFLGAPMSGRMTGFTEQVNHLGGAAAIVIAPALALVVTSTRLRRSLVWIGALVAIVAAAVLSGSVAGMAAAVGAIGIWLVISSRGPRPVVVAFAVLVLAVAVAQVQGEVGLPTPIDRVLSATGRSQGGQYSTVATRVRGYEAAWAAVGSGGWFGHGLDSGSPDPNGARATHNLLLKAWYEGGLAAASGMVCVMLGGLGCCLLAARLARTSGFRLLATSLFAAVAAFSAFGMSSPMLSQRYGWVSVALALCCLSIARSDAKGATQVERVDPEQAELVGAGT